MNAATLDKEGNALRFVNDEAGTYVEMTGHRRMRCSPYHLYRVLQGAICDHPHSPLKVEREDDRVLVHVEDETVAVPADRYECALQKAFGIGRA